MKIRKMMILFLLTLIVPIGCGKPVKEVVDINIEESKWEEIVEAAEGTTVTYYGWGGDEKVNNYIDQVVGTKLKEEYDITLQRVGMDITEIMTKLLTEREAQSLGTIDVVWLNGENFYTAKENKLLYGEILSKLPNNKYLDLEDAMNTKDFGVDTEGMEVPLGKAQFMLFGDTSKVEHLPINVDELMVWAKANPGRFTYPTVDDFTGSAFVRNIIFQFIDEEDLAKDHLTKEEIRLIIQPGLNYLLELKPYLWREGTTYPATSAQLSNMYADGEVDFGMTYTANGVSKMIEEGIYPSTTQSFKMEGGALSNTHFVTMPTNAPNQAGALVLMNELISPDMQLKKMASDSWADLTSLSMANLVEADRVAFENLEIGKGTLSVEELEKNTIYEPFAEYIPMIDELWKEYVLR